MAAQTMTVVGMTCDHCVRAVTAEVAKIAGVEQVDVDLTTGRVTVVSAGSIALELLMAAIEDAGYEVTA